MQDQSSQSSSSYSSTVPNVWSNLYNIMASLRSAAQCFYDAALDLCRALRSTFKAVYEHDPHTCPASIWHALLELARFYELCAGRFSNLFQALEDSLQIQHRDKPDWPVRAFREEEATSFTKSLPLRDRVSLAQRYLRSDPGGRVKCLARRYTLSKHAQEPRIHYDNRHFQRLRLSRDIPADPDAPAALLKAHDRMAASFLQLQTFVSDYDKAERALRANTTPPPPRALLDLASDFRSMVYTKLRLRTCRDLLLNQRYTGWTSSYVPKRARFFAVHLHQPSQQLGSTAEDDLGPIEAWAT